ncbi:MAG: sensor histidine kinase [Actinomycetota bacterium]|nr:sensor histidine kinase [Actinomycetota bacterium]
MAVVTVTRPDSHASTLIAARVLGATTVLGLALLERGDEAVLVAALTVMTSIAALAVGHIAPRQGRKAPFVEGAVAAVLATVMLTDTAVGLPYLLVPVFIAGLSTSAAGVVATCCVQSATVIGVAVVVPALDVSLVLDLTLPWLLTGLAAGMLGAWIRSTSVPRVNESDAYDSAHRLLSELRTVARKLSAGLDPVGIAHQILADVGDVVDDDSAVLLVRSAGGTLLPLAGRGAADLGGEAHDDHLVMECWTSEAPVHETVVVDGRRAVRIALPLRLGARMIAVLVLHHPTPLNSATAADVVERLRRHAVQLDTAMVFDEVRSLATIDERRRMAREIHDGIAQEVASLGYSVDSLMADTDDAVQRDGLGTLREQLTHLVSELRLSVFDLRSEVAPGSTLGSVLADYVHQVGRQTGMTVHLSLNETPRRLRVEVETEILRIAQEAITNARRHSGAHHLWVTLSADPPQATMSITDDGTGLGEAREDSFGMKIMKERADRIGADFAVVSEPDRGTSVALTLMTASALRLEGSSGADRKESRNADVGLAHR